MTSEECGLRTKSVVKDLAKSRQSQPVALDSVCVAHVQKAKIVARDVAHKWPGLEEGGPHSRASKEVLVCEEGSAKRESPT